MCVCVVVVASDDRNAIICTAQSKDKYAMVLQLRRRFVSARIIADDELLYAILSDGFGFPIFYH